MVLFLYWQFIITSLVKGVRLSNGCFRASLEAMSSIKFRTVPGVGEHSAVDDFKEQCLSETEANSGAILGPEERRLPRRRRGRRQQRGRAGTGAGTSNWRMCKRRGSRV